MDGSLELGTGSNAPFMLEELLIHGFSHHHLLIHFDKKLLSLLPAHFIDLAFKGSEIELLFKGKLYRFIHWFTPERENNLKG
jgi:hypothetical protein